MLVFKPPTKNISIDGIVIERKEIDTEYVYNIQSKNKTIPYRNWIRRRILKSFLSQINILKTNERQHHYKWKPPAENRIISYTLPNKFLQEYPTPYKTIASNYYANPHLVRYYIHIYTIYTKQLRVIHRNIVHRKLNIIAIVAIIIFAAKHKIHAICVIVVLNVHQNVVIQKYVRMQDLQNVIMYHLNYFVLVVVDLASKHQYLSKKTNL